MTGAQRKPVLRKAKPMVALTEYYGRARGHGSLDLRDLWDELSPDWLVTAATGAGLGMLSAALGGLDVKIFGFPVPVDGLASLGLGVAGVYMGGETGGLLKIASIAAGGSAAVRTFEGIFRRGFKVTGELEDLGGSGFTPAINPYGGSSWGLGFGRPEQDALINAAKYL
jgi:hypothetical protein